MELIKEDLKTNPAIVADKIVNSPLVVKNLQQHSLKQVLAALSDRAVSNSENILERAAKAVGLKPNIIVEKTVTIDRAATELYNYWRDLTNLPTFMGHLKSVTHKDEAGKVSHWVADAPLDFTVEWDAEIVRDEPGHLIAWSALENAQIDNCGFVRFQPATGGRGTQVKVVLEYQPPGGALTDAIASLFGESPQEQIGDELNRFKQLMETGEIATTEGQPQGS
ncbi:SRPBCC family protein [Myxosarcina sp. GI1]|uniref:SRPBCC family protein n=1 Tax=Myxosarcina sp. GI1 TaxID=1541065 RepID=UPI00068F371E|nr:SRPBCC family protein [Myxosarcina sp. GI1]